MVSDDFLHQERIVLDSAVDKLEDRMFAPDTTPETTSSSSAPAKLGAAGLSPYKEGSARYDAFEKAAAASQLPLEAADLDLPAAQYIANTEAVSAAGAKGSGAVPGAADEAEPVVHLTREQIANLACMCSLRRPHSPQVVHLTREQIANLAEAIDTMIDSPIRMERYRTATNDTALPLMTPHCH